MIGKNFSKELLKVKMQEKIEEERQLLKELEEYQATNRAMPEG